MRLSTSCQKKQEWVDDVDDVDNTNDADDVGNTNDADDVGDVDAADDIKNAETTRVRF